MTWDEERVNKTISTDLGINNPPKSAYNALENIENGNIDEYNPTDISWISVYRNIGLIEKKGSDYRIKNDYLED